MILTNQLAFIFLSLTMLRLTVKSFPSTKFIPLDSFRTFTSRSQYCFYSSPLNDFDNSRTTDSAKKSSKICIVGGGFGGLYTALKLSNLLKDKENIEITLIDPKDKFVFLPLLYELAIGSASAAEVSPRYDTLLKGTKVKFIQSTVSDIDFNTNEVKLVNKSMNIIKYDQLVLSVGAQPRIELVPGAKEYAMPFYRVEDADELRTRLKALMDNGKSVIRTVVLGGGYSGVEVATNVADYIGKDKAIVSIIDRNEKILKNSPQNNREGSEKALAALGVSINCNTSATRITESAVCLKDSSTGMEFEMPADIVIVTMGMEQSQLVKSAQLQKVKGGRISINRSLQSKEKPNVFCLGDCSGIEGEFIPSTAQVAMQQSDIVASNIMYRMNNYNQEDLINRVSRPDELDKFRYVPLGEMLTLGKTNAAVTSLNGLVQLQGPVAALGRRLVYAVRMPTPRQQATALFSAFINRVKPKKTK